MTKLSKEAKSALVNAKNSDSGRVRNVSPKTYTELREAGLIGPSRGLTRTGSIAQERAVNDLLDEMFS